MANRILITDIKIDRMLEPGDDLSDLSEDHLIDPVVVQGDVLIDGLRRIMLAQELGIEDILAEDPQTLEEACAALAWNHRHHQPSWERIAQIHPYLTRLVDARLKRMRSEQAKGRNKFQSWDPNRTRLAPSRDLITEAFGGIKSHQWERFMMLVREGREEVLRDIYDGKISPAAAYVQLSGRRNAFRGTVSDGAEQGEILTAAVQAMGATLSAIQRIALPIKVASVQAEAILADLYKVRATLSKIVHQLEEAVNDRNDQ